jgi:dTDP-4-amino-4,6-dideoxygalactose transaminase
MLPDFSQAASRRGRLPEQLPAINAIMHAGGTPVFCDVQRDTWHIDPAEIERKATPNTKAVILTHLWGLPADMTPILQVCRKLKLAVIEDVSHAQGSKYKGRYCGTIGDIGAFSLQGSKAIVAGEGGCLLTNNHDYYLRAHVPGHHSMRLGKALKSPAFKPFAIAGGSWTYRMAPVSAAIATAQLRKLDRFNAARQANFDRLYSRLKQYRFIRWPKLHRGSVRGWYGTPAIFDAKKAPISRDTFVEACGAEGSLIGGEGYTDYTQLPLFQDMSIFSQMFVPCHANGVAFRPVRKGELPNYDAIKASTLRFVIPAEETPLLMDQVADTVAKVMANVPALRAWEKRQAKKK